MIFIPLKDIEHCVLNIFNAETGENLGQIEDVTDVTMVSENKTDYQRDKYGEIASRFVHDPTYTLSFNANKPISKEDFDMFLGIDKSNMPDACNVQFIKFVQARKHKKRRINKKWLKRYGYKQISVESKGWKMKADTDGNVEFIK